MITFLINTSATFIELKSLDVESILGKSESVMGKVGYITMTLDILWAVTASWLPLLSSKSFCFRFVFNNIESILVSTYSETCKSSEINTSFSFQIVMWHTFNSV